MTRPILLSLLLALSLLGCTAAERVTRFPVNAAREAPPPGIAASAVKVGARAPDVTLPTSSGARWTLEGARQSGPAVLVFYRGDW